MIFYEIRVFFGGKRLTTKKDFKELFNTFQNVIQNGIQSVTYTKVVCKAYKVFKVNDKKNF